MTTSTFANKKIGIIGAGKMGTALYQSLISIHPPEHVLLCDRHPSKLQGEQTTTAPQKVASECDVVILAVKPKEIHHLEINLEHKILISVLAGISIKTLSNATKTNQIVRAMPNLPIQTGTGVVAWVASEALMEKDFVKYLFSPMGLDMELSKEELLHSVTAISGSGPAYFFFLCEILASKAQQFGFSPKEARELAEMTLIGSASLLAQKEQSAEQWRHSVTSAGGTTEAALNHLQTHSFGDLFKEAVECAKRRSEELSRD